MLRRRARLPESWAFFAAIVLTFGLLWYQRQVIERTGSVAIETDHVHYQSDLLLNLSVIVALVLDQLMGFRMADPLFGIGIAAWLIFGAWRAASRSSELPLPYGSCGVRGGRRARRFTS